MWREVAAFTSENLRLRRNTSRNFLLWRGGRGSWKILSIITVHDASEEKASSRKTALPIRLVPRKRSNSFGRPRAAALTWASVPARVGARKLGIGATR